MVPGPEGDLYVTSRDSAEVLRFDGQNGAFVGSVPAARPEILNSPKGIVFDGSGVLYVTSTAGDQVLRSAPKSEAVFQVDLSVPVPETITIPRSPTRTTPGGVKQETTPTRTAIRS